MSASSPVQPVPAPVVGRSRARRPSCGSEILDAAYQQLLKTIERLGMPRLSVDLQDRPGWSSMVVAGMWRADRQDTLGTLELSQWNEEHQRWEPVEHWAHFPDVQLLPLRRLDATRVMRGALALLQHQTGWASDEHWDTVLRQAAQRWNHPWPTVDTPWPERLKHLQAFRVNGTAHQCRMGMEHLNNPSLAPWWKRPGMELFHEERRHQHRLSVLHKLLVARLEQGLIRSFSPTQDPATRGLVKRLWQRLVDPSLLKLIGLARMRQPVRWVDYTDYARHAPALRKVGQEHPNLLPLLDVIRPKYWGRPNLFSRRRWVRDGRKELVIETTTFRRQPLPQANQGQVAQQPFVPFEQPAAFRWMLKASPLVISRWLTDFQGDGRVLERCVRLNLPPSTSPLIWDAVLRQCLDYTSRRYTWFTLPIEPAARAIAKDNATAAMDRALRLYALHLIEHWKTHGLRNMLKYNARQEHNFDQILDWIRGEAGALGLPDKNARWDSMQRASRAWHERRQREAEWENQPFNYSWFSSWGEPEVIQQVLVTPLTNSDQLWREGSLMKHCVGWNGYDRACYDGGSQIFSLIEQDSSRRSTLCLIRIEASGYWRVQQNRSYHNQAVSDRLSEVGKQVAQRLNERDDAFRASGQAWPKAQRVPQEIQTTKRAARARREFFEN